MSFETNETLNGTDGKLWINDTPCATVKSFTVKQTNVYEDVDKSGQLSKSRRLVGIEYSGTISKYLVDNTIAGLMQESANGEMPEIKLIGLIENKKTGMMRRAVVKGVTFDELNLINFEQKTVLMEEIPFQAEDVKYQDLT